MIYLFLLIASMANAQSTMTVQSNIFEDNKISNIAKDLRDIQKGRAVITGQPKFQNGLRFGDGTIQVSSPTAVAAQFVSTYTIIVADIAVNTTAGVCYSTATATFNGGRLHVYLTGADVHNASSNDKTKVAFLIDGDYPAPFNALSGDRKAMVGGNNSGQDHQASFSWTTLSNVTPGSHSICLTTWRAAGSGATLYCGTDSAHPNCILGITEIK